MVDNEINKSGKRRIPFLRCSWELEVVALGKETKDGMETGPLAFLIKSWLLSFLICVLFHR